MMGGGWAFLEQHLCRILHLPTNQTPVLQLRRDPCDASDQMIDQSGDYDKIGGATRTIDRKLVGRERKKNSITSLPDEHEGEISDNDETCHRISKVILRNVSRLRNQG